MGSRALRFWETDRIAALARMENVHAAVTGGLRGRPRDVTELNHALFLRLAAEVQGFCRDLHDESIDAICVPAQVPSPDLLAAFRALLSNGRRLDSGNAGPGNIGADWARLNIQIWPDISAHYPGGRGKTDWHERLEWLNSARNGIAHNDEAKIAEAHAKHPLTLSTFRTMRSRMSRFAVALDRRTSAYLRAATGAAPW